MRLLLMLMLFLIAAPASARDGFVVFMLDDVGMFDIGTYGGSAPATTTNIDAFATGGVKFTNFTTEPACQQARTAFLTGLYAPRTGIGWVLPSEPQGDATWQVMDKRHATLPKMLRRHGWKTSLIGKNHVTEIYKDAYSDIGFNEWRAGMYANFTEELPDIGGIGTLSYRNWVRCDNGVCAQETDYVTTVQTDEAIAAYQENADSDHFMLVALNDAHFPWVGDDNIAPGSSCGASAADCYTDKIEYVDAEFLRFMNVVDLTDTTVCVMSDNGTPNSVVTGDYISGKVKGTVYLPGNQGFLICKGHWVTDPGSTDAMVNVVDFYATVASLAGITTRSIDSLDFSGCLSTRAGCGSRTTSVYHFFTQSGESDPPHQDDSTTTRYDVGVHTQVDGTEEYALVRVHPVSTLDFTSFTTNALYDADTDYFAAGSPISGPPFTGDDDDAYTQATAALDSIYDYGGQPQTLESCSSNSRLPSP